MVSRQLNLFQCWNEPLTVFTPPTFDMGVIRSLFKKGVGTEIIASDSPPNCGMDVIAIIYRNHTCKKRVMLRGGYFGQNKFAEKVRKSRQNVDRDKSA